MRTAASWSGARGTPPIQARGGKSPPPMASSPPTVTPASPLGRAAWSDTSDRGASDERLTSRAPYKLPPRPARARAVLLDQPLAGPAQLQAGAVHQQVRGLGLTAGISAARPRRPRHLQRRRAPTEGGVVRHAQRQPEQADDGADQPLGLRERQAEHRKVSAVRIARGEYQAGLFGSGHEAF